MEESQPTKVKCHNIVTAADNKTLCGGTLVIHMEDATAPLGGSVADLMPSLSQGPKRVVSICEDCHHRIEGDPFDMESSSSFDDAWDVFVANLPRPNPSKESLMAMRFDSQSKPPLYAEHVAWFNDTYVEKDGVPLHRGLRLAPFDDPPFIQAVPMVALHKDTPLEQQLAAEDFLPLMEAWPYGLHPGSAFSTSSAKVFRVFCDAPEELFVLVVHTVKAGMDGWTRKDGRASLVSFDRYGGGQDWGYRTDLILSAPDLRTVLQYVHQHFPYTQAGDAL